LPAWTVRSEALARGVFAIALASLALMVAPPASVRAAGMPRVEIVAPSGTARASVNVEISDSEGEREFGLMYREHLEEGAGMLFVFAAPSHQTFWMKHTEIPLDMMFADAGGRIVGIVQNATPESEKMLSVDGDSQYVLEVSGGYCKRHGIATGDRLRFVGFTPHARD
jgi:uncharacterized membrane protein (UPF0127 family)